MAGESGDPGDRAPPRAVCARSSGARCACCSFPPPPPTVAPGRLARSRPRASAVDVGSPAHADPAAGSPSPPLAARGRWVGAPPRPAPPRPFRRLPRLPPPGLPSGGRGGRGPAGPAGPGGDGMAPARRPAHPPGGGGPAAAWRRRRGSACAGRSAASVSVCGRVVLERTRPPSARSSPRSRPWAGRHPRGLRAMRKRGNGDGDADASEALTSTPADGGRSQGRSRVLLRDVAKLPHPVIQLRAAELDAPTVPHQPPPEPRCRAPWKLWSSLAESGWSEGWGRGRSGIQTCLRP